MYKNNDISNNLWKYWNLNDIQITNETNRLIKSSTQINDDLSKMKINNINDVTQFLKIMATDINEIQSFHSTCGVFQFIGVNDKIKKAGWLADIEFTKYYNQLNTNKLLYDKIAYIKENYNKKLDSVDNRFLDKLVINYKRNGINLKNDKKDLLDRIRYEISKLENAIFRYINDHENDIIELTLENLKGVPDNIVNSLLKIDNNFNIYKIHLNKQNYNLLIKYISDKNIRKKIEIQYVNRFDNIIEHICKLIVLRDKHAKLLSYDNHSDYKSFIQMTKHSDNIKNFLTELLSKLDFRYKREMDTIIKLNNKHNDHSQINNFDVPYYINKWKQEYGINDNIIREYFELNTTLNNILNIYHKLFDVNFNKVNSNNVWHNDVTIYSITSIKNELLGYLYLDLYSREGKYKQIRCFSLQPGTNEQIPITALITSFNKNNILITFQDMISIYHEFAHVMHNIFGRTKYSVFSGVNVENDFVETPAQMLDFMCWEKNTIRTISQHYKTKNSLSDDIINKIIKIKNLDIGLYYKKHIMIALFDQLIYSSDNFIDSCENLLKSGDKYALKNLLINLFKNLHNEIMNADGSPNYKILLNDECGLPVEWIHALCSSDAQYYSSIWSRVLSADMYNDKIKGKELNSKIGNELRKHILQFGGTKNAYDMICDYIQRKPAVNGFISMFDLDADMEYSFFLNTDQIKSTQFNNKQNNQITQNQITQTKKHITKQKHDDDNDSISNKFSEIYESSVNRDDFDNQTEDANYLKNKFKKYAY